MDEKGNALDLDVVPFCWKFSMLLTLLTRKFVTISCVVSFYQRSVYKHGDTIGGMMHSVWEWHAPKIITSLYCIKTLGMYVSWGLGTSQMWSNWSSFSSDKTLEIKPVYLDMLMCEFLYIRRMSTKDFVLLINIFESKLQMIVRNIFNYT